jgi:Spy/CpxP family protein refolding chaperone
VTQGNKARREAATLFVAVFLLGALLGGFGTHLWAGRVSGGPIETHKGPPSREDIISNFTRELQLTPAQQQQLGVIIDSAQAKLRALYGPVDIQKDAIRKESHERVRAILTPEQVPKFDDFSRRMDEQHKRDTGR